MMTEQSVRDHVYQFLRKYDQDEFDEETEKGFHYCSRGTVLSIVPWNRVYSNICNSNMQELVDMIDTSGITDHYDIREVFGVSVTDEVFHNWDGGVDDYAEYITNRIEAHMQIGDPALINILDI